MKKAISFIGMFLVLVVACLTAGCGFHNASTGAGEVGYVTRDAVMGQTKYVGLQTGPSSTGMSWMVSVINVSVTPYNYEEAFSGDDAVVANDKLRVEFKVNVSWQVTDVKNYVENYMTYVPGKTPDEMAKSAYDMYIRPLVHTYARQEVERYAGFDIKSNIGKINAAVMEDIAPMLDGTPFKISSVNMASPQLPEKVVTATKSALQATVTLQQKDTEIEIKRAEKEKTIHDAQGIAASMRELSSKLTPEYLAYESLNIQKESNSKNHSTIYLNRGMNVTGTMPVTPPAPEKK